MDCHHGQASHAMFCSMKAGHQLMDFGFLAPLAPTTLSSSVSLVVPIPARAKITQRDVVAYSGFPSTPFEPPRS
jgi:hypothetical protein